MTEERISHYLCVGCPLGCRLEVEEDERDTIVEVRGWSCKKGERYGRQEHTDPRRMVTTTVGIEGASLARLPVKTNRPVPKEQVREVCRLLRALHVAAPDVLPCDLLVNEISHRLRPKFLRFIKVEIHSFLPSFGCALIRPHERPMSAAVPTGERSRPEPPRRVG